MMAKRLDNRVSELERRRDGSGIQAIWWADNETLRVVQTDERLTPEEFSERYPDGTIIHMVYVKQERSSGDGKET